MTDIRQTIAEELEVVTEFNAAHEAERRIQFLAEYLRHTQTAGYVLGISGGVDSTVGGRLAQLACERVRESGYEARFVAMRLPYGTQADEDDAQQALAFIEPDELITIDIKPSVDALWDGLLAAGMAGPGATDFVRGNVKARVRMVAQYAVAGARGMLVVGTDQAAEALVGFFTKFGDNAVDLTPLTGLSKRRVRQLGRYLGAAENLIEKVPTADLEDDQPLAADELALGVSYDAVDDFLEGIPVSAAAEQTILGWYHRTAHKRALPITPGQWETRHEADPERG
jgi:NAD+ synthase